MKIVVLGSCKYGPYIFLAVPDPIPGAHNTEVGYQVASEKFYPAIEAADEIWVYAPDGLGEHTSRDLAYAHSKGKTIRTLRTLWASSVNSNCPVPGCNYKSESDDALFGHLYNMHRKADVIRALFGRKEGCTSKIPEAAKK